MSHYLFELAVFMLIAYFLGCLFGWFMRNVFGTHPHVAAIAAPMVAAAAPVVAHRAPTPIPMARAAPVPVVVARAGKVERPKGLSAARGGKADNLLRISGIGPKNESVLHGLGIFHFDQIAAWTSSEVSWVDNHLNFNGRIVREEWIHQASLLAAGKEEEFMRKYGTGGLKGKDGQT
ncbi:MAG: hypothetical protein ABJA10_01030, partial [Aestuariivirga sp.]